MRCSVLGVNLSRLYRFGRLYRLISCCLQLLRRLTLHNLKEVVGSPIRESRQVKQFATSTGENTPSYWTIYRVVRDLPEGLLTLAHRGNKAYSESFDLVHRREASVPERVNLTARLSTDDERRYCRQI